MINKLDVIITSTYSNGFIAEGTNHECVFIDKKVHISGCKFEYLKVGDELICFNLIPKRWRIPKQRSHYYNTKRAELKDIEAKWNDILKDDSKYSIDHSLDIKDTIIRPEIIKPTFINNGLLHYDHFQRLIDNDKIKNDVHRKVIEMHLKGLTTREMSTKVKRSHMTCARIIKKYQGFDR